MKRRLGLQSDFSVSRITLSFALVLIGILLTGSALTKVGAEPRPSSPEVTLFPASLDFPLTLVGEHSSASVTTLTNTGTSVLTIFGIRRSGEFGLITNCHNLNPGASCSLEAWLKPTTKGKQTGAITILDDAADSPQIVPLTGLATVVQLSPTRLNFGNQTVGTTGPPQIVTLSNLANTTLTIRDLTVLGINFSDFMETSTCGSTVPPNSNCEITLTFTPSAIGTRQASLSVSDNGGGGTQRIKLTGIGVSN